ncbi:MAG TPA: class I SAM-dependent methyltransferase [Polyangium sp.]|nr:class I SAM-dependent methyltransferase [Polyangium sp.]
MTAGKIHLTNDKPTFFATLYGKALDARKPKPILGDRWAAEAVDRIDFNFGSLKLPEGAPISLSVRAKHFDDWTRAFLDKHSRATVLHLGCGLDTRVYRVNPSPQVRWYDVDFPDVITMRQKLFPERPGYHMIGSSVTNLGWMDGLAPNGSVFVVGEGLFMYVPENEGLDLFQRIVEQFPSGQIAFDAYSASMVRLVSRLATVRGAKVELVWGIDDPHDVEKRIEGLRLVEDVPFLTMPLLVEHLSPNWFAAKLHAFMGRRNFYQKLVRHVRYAF